jgi:hypothetical protein
VQNVHQIAETNRSPETLTFGVEARDPNLAALDPPVSHPGERALDQRTTHAAAAFGRTHHQVRDLGPPHFPLNRGCAVDPRGAKAQQGAIAFTDEYGRIGIAEDRGEQAVDLGIRVGAQGKERITRRVMLTERNPEFCDPIEVARIRTANAPGVSLRGRGPRQFAS